MYSEIVLTPKGEGVESLTTSFKDIFFEDWFKNTSCHLKNVLTFCILLHSWNSQHIRHQRASIVLKAEPIPSVLRQTSMGIKGIDQSVFIRLPLGLNASKAVKIGVL